jgi:hypothetical protein
MIRYVILAASVAMLASLGACATGWAPIGGAPRVGGPDAHESESDKASYSSQLSVINRRAEHAKKGDSSSSSSSSR